MSVNFTERLHPRDREGKWRDKPGLPRLPSGRGGKPSPVSLYALKKVRRRTGQEIVARQAKGQDISELRKRMEALDRRIASKEEHRASAGRMIATRGVSFPVDASGAKASPATGGAGDHAKEAERIRDRIGRVSGQRAEYEGLHAQLAYHEQRAKLKPNEVSVAPEFEVGKGSRLKMVMEPARGDIAGRDVFRLEDSEGFVVARGSRKEMGKLWAEQEAALGGFSDSSPAVGPLAVGTFVRMSGDRVHGTVVAREGGSRYSVRWSDSAGPVSVDISELRIPSKGKASPASGGSVDAIRVGDRVTIRTPQGQERTGRAVMRGPAGWVLNMGGPHGTPGIASDSNIVSVRASGGTSRGLRSPATGSRPSGKASPTTGTAAERVARAAGDAHMVDNYGEAAWRNVARFLLKQGHSEKEAEAILRSKHMRWADDTFGGGKKPTSGTFRRYYAKYKPDMTGKALAALVADTFPAEGKASPSTGKAGSMAGGDGGPLRGAPRFEVRVDGAQVGTALDPIDAQRRAAPHARPGSKIEIRDGRKKTVRHFEYDGRVMREVGAGKASPATAQKKDMEAFVANFEQMKATAAALGLPFDEVAMRKALGIKDFPAPSIKKAPSAAPKAAPKASAPKGKFGAAKMKALAAQVPPTGWSGGFDYDPLIELEKADPADFDHLSAGQLQNLEWTAEDVNYHDVAQMARDALKRKKESGSALADLGVEKGLHTPSDIGGLEMVTADEFGSLQGKGVVVTGKLTTGTRDEIHGKIAMQGGIAHGSISGQVDLLVVGDKPGSKLAKAKAMGIPVMTEHEFALLVEALQEARVREVERQIEEALAAGDNTLAYRLRARARALREGVLTAKKRKSLPQSAFALPGGRYPIHDEAHARNALARVAQYGTPEEKAKVRAAVRRRYPKIEVAAA